MTISLRFLLALAVSAVAAACAAAPEAGGQNDTRSRTAIVLAWTRSGGLAGFCDQLELTATGDVTAKSCKTSGARTRQLSSDERRRLDELRQELGSVAVTSSDHATADAMSQTLTLKGTGSRQPSEAQRQELLDWAQRVYSNTIR